MAKRSRRGVPPRWSDVPARRAASRRAPRKEPADRDGRTVLDAFGREGVEEVADLPLHFHPRRGTVVGPLHPGQLGYRGGPDAGWEHVATLRVRRVRTASGRTALAAVPGQTLPRGFLWGDPSRQNYGMGGPDLVIGPLERNCCRCGAPFVASAQEQQRLHETLGLHIDVMPVHCAECRTVKGIRKRYSEQVRGLATDPSPAAHLEVARLAARLLAAGDRVDVDRAIGFSRRAKRSRQHARDAEDVEEALLALRASDITFLNWR